MQTFRYKTLVAALAVAGLATACDRNSVERDAYVPPDRPPIERSTMAEGTTSPSAIQSVDERGYSHEADLTPPGELTEADHEETLQFVGGSLTAESEGKLGQLVSNLDADKPVTVIVAMDEHMYEDDQGLQTGTSAEQPHINQDNRERYTSTFGQRVETVKQYMEEQGIEVAQWQFERLEVQDLAQQRNAQEEEQEVQSVRLVISASAQERGFSSLSDD